MNQVFGRYDWDTDTIPSTLWEVVTHEHCSHLSSRNAPRSEKSASSSQSSGLEQGPPSGQESPRSPTSSVLSRSHAARGRDEVLISEQLLARSPSSMSSPPESVKTRDPWVSDLFSSSPTGRDEPSFSPLQQSILAYAEQDIVAHGPRLSATAQDASDYQNAHRRVTAPAGTSYEESLEPYQPQRPRRTATMSALQRRNAWLAEMQASCILPTNGLGVPTQPPRRPLGFLRRRSSAPKERFVAPFISIARSRSESRFDYTRRHVRFFDEIDHGVDEEAVFPDDIELEDDVEENGPPQVTSKAGAVASRLAGVVSAIHYQYVSIELRIQLAVHRTEKKIVRKLSASRRRQATL
ncbi:hypothetical protein CVT26_003782 [Gymnopilus dilepis]|uniref:Uncharacterized protein n=1 Tax=Gymnopilus dilepis TaxID=231916 RepID=A0A409W1M0_9AGAR|nr:hypothetical protein CVT26_003782 [Gymnopilus dilepis]